MTNYKNERVVYIRSKSDGVFVVGMESSHYSEKDLEALAQTKLYRELLAIVPLEPAH